MLTNYIYLLHESEFVNKTENIYKIGRTKQENIKRFNQYPKGSRLLFQMICNKCENVETHVLKVFNEKFIQRKDIGNEYFEGDYHSMIDIIYLIIKNEDIEDEDIDIEDEEKVKFNLLCEKISKIFPDYKNDESFGGNKKYIMINNNYSVCYINPLLKNNLDYYYKKIDNLCESCEEIFHEYIIIEYDLNENVADRLQYFNNLIRKKTIQFDKIYDINSSNFIYKINKTKINLKIENYDEFSFCTSNISIYCKLSEKIRQLFNCNMIIYKYYNKYLYSVMEIEDDNYDNYYNYDIFKKFKNLKDFNSFSIDIGTKDYISTKIYKINNKFYDYETYLRKYTPYLIRWNKENNYYILNRDYEYIGLNVKYIEYDKKGQSYLFNDGSVPFEDKQNLIKMCNEYKKIIKKNELNECLNENKFTQNIISLFN